jgi:hypothetical protein
VNKAGRKYNVVILVIILIFFCIASGVFLAYYNKEVAWLGIPLGALCTAPGVYIGANAYIRGKENKRDV